MYAIIMMLHRQEKGTWHPICYVEDSPPAKGEAPRNFIKYKAFGHHEGGFAVRNDAMAYVLCRTFRDGLSSLSLELLYNTEGDVEWAAGDWPKDDTFTVSHPVLMAIMDQQPEIIDI